MGFAPRRANCGQDLGLPAVDPLCVDWPTTSLADELGA